MANRAFLIGVNKYEMPGSNLQGCVNDITNVRDVMQKYYGFAVKDIRMLPALEPCPGSPCCPLRIC